VPIQRGDEVLLVFASRSIDGWYDKSGVQPQTHERMHDPSDGFAILGTRSKPRAVQNVSTNNIQLRSDDGKVFLEIQNSRTSTQDVSQSGQVLRIVAPTKIRFETPLLEVTGKIEAVGHITSQDAVEAGVGTGDHVTMQKHTHGGVQSGGSHTSGPDPGT
jgi:phage baseplate assembly protein gpV